MALEGMSAVLNECILNIFRGHEVALNNQHLMQFTETAESWNPILDLIQSPLPHVGFFSMNLLLNKVHFLSILSERSVIQVFCSSQYFS